MWLRRKECDLGAFLYEVLSSSFNQEYMDTRAGNHCLKAQATISPTAIHRQFPMHSVHLSCRR